MIYAKKKNARNILWKGGSSTQSVRQTLSIHVSKKEIYIYMKVIHGKLRMVHTMVIVIMEEVLFASGCKTLGYTIFLVLAERL